VEVREEEDALFCDGPNVSFIQCVFRWAHNTCRFLDVLIPESPESIFKVIHVFFLANQFEVVLCSTVLPWGRIPVFVVSLSRYASIQTWREGAVVSDNG
jgi:hypothetical protein